MNAFIIALIGLFGAWLGSHISKKSAREATETTHRNAIELININNRKLTGIRLREAFISALAQLDLARKEKFFHEFFKIESRLVDILPIQAEAIKAYSFFISKDKQPEYQKAWDDYYETVELHDIEKCGSLAKKIVGNEDTITSLEQKIHAILLFAKEK